MIMATSYRVVTPTPTPQDIDKQARMDRIARRLDRLRIELGLDADKRKAS